MFPNGNTRRAASDRGRARGARVRINVNSGKVETVNEQAMASVESFAAELGDKVLHCRELGHVWRPLTVSYDQSARAYDRRLRCSSCRTVRVQLLTERGHVVSNRYVYADGYLAHGVTIGRGDRDAFRVEAINRWMRASAESEVAS